MSRTINGRSAKGFENRLQPEDRPAHGWYRFVLSFPPHLVRDYLDRLGVQPGQCVLDPFCGTGTTLVECKKVGVKSVGIEANPMAWFASSVKIDWGVNPDRLASHAQHVAEIVSERLDAAGIDDADDLPLFHRRRASSAAVRCLPEAAQKLLLTNSISRLPLHKTLVLLEALDEEKDARYDRHERLALASALVYEISNLHFGPEVGVGRVKADSPVVPLWLRAVNRMADDLRGLRGNRKTMATAHCADARAPAEVLNGDMIDAVITSPPYPNEKDYTRTTRLESVLLGFIRDRGDLRQLKQGLVRSNTRGVYKGDADDALVKEHPEIQRIAGAIEKRRIRMNKTSGFERMYARVTKLYFGGMARHLSGLAQVLRPGAKLAYVVGDQASYLQVMIRTGQILADIATSLGYEVLGIDLFRTRMATATKEKLREEVLVLRWPGKAK